jgi:hypothetical protein
MRRTLSIAVVLLVCIAGTSHATTSLMQLLPESGRFACLNCHTDAAPAPGAAALNGFGSDFLANGKRWDATLAAKRSDGDNCTNGFELGDENGDGRPDPGVTEARSNPGVSDCTLQLTPQAWSALKQLFR